jgi:two-component system, NarL family, nitrate/nitrite response regulator NarL
MDATPSTIRLLLVSRHTLIRTALVRLMTGHGGVVLVGDVGTRPQALAVAAQHMPDVIVFEPHPDTDLWLDAIGPLITAAGVQSRVLVLTALTDPDLHRQALRHGARGILDLDHPPETLFRAIQHVHDGDVWMDRRLLTDLVKSVAGAPTAERARIDSLTAREREVVRLVSEGLKNKQIAERLSIADVTVRHHLTSVFAKLQVADRLSLVVFAFHQGLTQPQSNWHKRA